MGSHTMTLGTPAGRKHGISGGMPLVTVLYSAMGLVGTSVSNLGKQ